MYYFKADAGLCEYDRATGVETVRFPMEAYTANPCYTRNYILVRSTDTEDFEQCTLWVLDRDYNLLGKAPQEKIGRWFPQPYAITAALAVGFGAVTMMQFGTHSRTLLAGYY